MAINNISPKKGKVVDIPDATITIGTPTAGAGQVSVAFTVATTPATGGPVQGYTAISNPGSITANSSASPVVVTGLTNGTAYTFQVAARNATGRGPLSSASASATPVDPASFESIATASGTGSSGVITFSSIPSTYKHLQIRSINRTTTATGDGDPFNIRLNSDTGANYSWHMIQGYVGASSGVNANAGANETSMLNGYAAGASNSTYMFSVSIIDLLDYQDTNKYKTIRTLQGFDANGDGAGGRYYGSRMFSGSWRNTSAVTSITITAPNGNWTTNSSFALYGIKG